MKKNRSNVFTKGICNTLRENKEWKFLFFEIDKEHLQYTNFITKIYLDNKLDYLIHKTGGGGLHFLSPTLITKVEWKIIMEKLRFINTKCPMNTLRIQPNKYPNEELIWYRFDSFEDSNKNGEHNHIDMCLLLNKIWGSNFKGVFKKYEIIQVNYPLPYPKVLI